MQAEPFTIAVPDADLDDLRLRLAHARWADDWGNTGWIYVMELGVLEDMVGYWRYKYDSCDYARYRSI